MLDWLRARAREFVDGGWDGVDVEARVPALARVWGVTEDTARRTVWEYAAQRGMLHEEALDVLAGMDWDEVCEELGVR